MAQEKIMNTISVVIPAYNSAAFILDALTSVERQTEKPLEVIVTDDASTDETISIVENFFAAHPHILGSLLRNPHAGAGENRNRGIAKAQGTWIAFLDSDDVWHPKKIETVCQRINQQPSVDLWCHSYESDSLSKKQKYLLYRSFNPQKTLFLNLYRNNIFLTSAVTVRRSFLQKSGGFDNSFPCAQDYDLWFRLALAGCQAGFIEDVLVSYRVRGGNISSHPEKMLADELAIERKNVSFLKAQTPFWMFERLRFFSRVYMSCGLVFLTQKKYLKGFSYAVLGFMFFPFRAEPFKIALRKIQKK